MIKKQGCCPCKMYEPTIKEVAKKITWNFEQFKRRNARRNSTKIFPLFLSTKR